MSHLWQMDSNLFPCCLSSLGPHSRLSRTFITSRALGQFTALATSHPWQPPNCLLPCLLRNGLERSARPWRHFSKSTQRGDLKWTLPCPQHTDHTTELLLSHSSKFASKLWSFLISRSDISQSGSMKSSLICAEKNRCIGKDSGVEKTTCEPPARC